MMIKASEHEDLDWSGIESQKNGQKEEPHEM